MIWCVIWVVLMMFWLFFGFYTGYDAGKPLIMGNTIIPWLCVAILGLILFGGISPGVVSFR